MAAEDAPGKQGRRADLGQLHLHLLPIGPGGAGDTPPAAAHARRARGLTAFGMATSSACRRVAAGVEPAIIRASVSGRPVSASMRAASRTVLPMNRRMHSSGGKAAIAGLVQHLAQHAVGDRLAVPPARRRSQTRSRQTSWVDGVGWLPLAYQGDTGPPHAVCTKQHGCARFARSARRPVEQGGAGLLEQGLRHRRPDSVAPPGSWSRPCSGSRCRSRLPRCGSASWRTASCNRRATAMVRGGIGAGQQHGELFAAIARQQVACAGSSRPTTPSPPAAGIGRPRHGRSGRCRP